MIEFSPLVRFALLLVRPGMLVMSAPPFGPVYAPAQVRLGLTFLVAFLLLPTIPVPVSMPLVTLAAVVARELAIGLALGLSVRALMAGAELAGHISGFQIGFSYGAIVDPQSGVRNNMLAALYGNLALLTFFAMNGHHAMLRALAGSYTRLPIATGHVDASLVRAVSEMLGIVFVLGIRLAMPLMVVLLVVELAMGLITRAAPSVNIMAVGMPIRIIVGLLMIAAVVGVAPPLVSRFIERAIAAGLHAASAFR